MISSELVEVARRVLIAVREAPLDADAAINHDVRQLAQGVIALDADGCPYCNYGAEHEACGTLPAGS